MLDEPQRLAAAAIALLACLGLCQCGADGESEIRWTPALGLQNLEQIDRRLAAAWEDPLKVGRVESGTIEKAVITDCLSYFDLTRRGFESAPYHYLLALGAECHALRALREARPAERTYLAGLRLDETAVDFLPPDLSLIVSNDEARKVADANDKQLSWRQFQPEIRVTAEDDQTLRVEGDGWGVRVGVYAFGDFNGDGLEDLLLRTDGWLTEGSYATTRLLALSRSGENGRLRLIREYDLTE